MNIRLHLVAIVLFCLAVSSVMGMEQSKEASVEQKLKDKSNKKLDKLQRIMRPVSEEIAELEQLLVQLKKKADFRRVGESYILVNEQIRTLKKQLARQRKILSRMEKKKLKILGRMPQKFVLKRAQKEALFNFVMDFSDLSNLRFSTASFLKLNGCIDKRIDILHSERNLAEKILKIAIKLKKIELITFLLEQISYSPEILTALCLDALYTAKFERKEPFLLDIVELLVIYGASLDAIKNEADIISQDGSLLAAVNAAQLNWIIAIIDFYLGYAIHGLKEHFRELSENCDKAIDKAVIRTLINGLPAKEKRVLNFD